VRKRRNDSRGVVAAIGRIAGSLVLLLWAKVARRPVDSVALLAALAASLIIIVNAVFLQAAPRPAPFLMTASPPAAGVRGSALANPPIHPAQGSRMSQVSPTPHSDPIAQLIDTSSRIMAVQRVLSDYGYGQIKPNGVLDPPTSAAIEKFEREHNLPVTGRISERLLTDLALMSGRPLE
jgi:hypothetical protein